jgi:hypothetical protein
LNNKQILWTEEEIELGKAARVLRNFGALANKKGAHLGSAVPVPEAP